MIWSPSRSWPSPTGMRACGNRGEQTGTGRRVTPRRNDTAYWAVRRFRDRHRAEGLCIFCSRPNDGRPSALCRFHRRQQRERVRARDWIKGKTCQACGRGLSRDEILRGCRYHLTCWKAHRRQYEAARRQEPAYRRRHAAYELARQNRLIAAGLCARCGQPRTGRRFCRACLDKMNQAWRKRQSQH
jgi:hypothetical protein